MRIRVSFFLALLALASAHGAPVLAAGPNFVIILADDLGYGDLGTYGGWIHTPHLDRMAAEGMRFTDFHSNGAVCSPTRAALLTGRYQQRAGIPGVVFADPGNPVHQDGLQGQEVTFAELLRDAGYATGMFGKWHLGYLPRYNPSLQGFGVFRGYVSGNVDFFSHVDQAGAFDWWHNLELNGEPGYVTHLINRYSVEFIKENRNRRFCLYVPHEAPHSPYQGPRDGPVGFRLPGETTVRQNLTQEEIFQKYREMVMEMDDGVGQILATLRDLGIANNTLVFFFSDNGGTRNGSNGVLRGFKGSLWEGGHREPAIAWWPGRVAAGAQTAQLAIGMDLMPTMLELAGLPLPSDRKLDGVSLAPVLLRGESVARGPVFWQYGDQLAMRDGRWKYVRNATGMRGEGLFDLEKDLGEQRNLADAEPARLQTMASAADEWLRQALATRTRQLSEMQ